MTVRVLGNNSSKQTDAIMRSSLQKCWRILLIPALGLMLTDSQVAAQGAEADMLSADSHLNLLSNGGFEVMKPSY